MQGPQGIPGPVGALGASGRTGPTGNEGPKGMDGTQVSSYKQTTLIISEIPRECAAQWLVNTWRRHAKVTVHVLNLCVC